VTFKVKDYRINVSDGVDAPDGIAVPR